MDRVEALPDLRFLVVGNDHNREPDTVAHEIVTPTDYFSCRPGQLDCCTIQSHSLSYTEGCAVCSGEAEHPAGELPGRPPHDVLLRLSATLHSDVTTEPQVPASWYPYGEYRNVPDEDHGFLDDDAQPPRSGQLPEDWETVPID